MNQNPNNKEHTILSITSAEDNQYDDLGISPAGEPGRKVNKLQTKRKIVMIGSGAYGTAIANALAEHNNNEVLIYGIDKEEIYDIDKNKKNSKYYSTKLSKNIKATRDKVHAFADADIIIIGLPTQAVETVIKNTVLPNITKPAYFINLSKGLDYISVKSISEKLDSIIPASYNLGVAKLSGPSFAGELVQKSPTALVGASKNEVLRELMVDLFSQTKYIHIEMSTDILGVEYSSIFKNSLAILLGIANGLGFKRNTISIIFVNALNEVRMLGSKMGIEDDTILGYAGLGDLYLTGSSLKSRNFSVGYRIGKQNKMSKKVVQGLQTIEGLKSIEFLQGIASHQSISLPLNTLLYEIVYLGKVPREALTQYLLDFCSQNQ